MAQKTLIQIITLVASEMNLQQPQTVIGSTVQTTQKLLALAHAVGDDLLYEFDWPFLQTRTTVTTSNGVDNYAFPTDIQRMISGTFWNQATSWKMRGSLTPVEWERLQVTSISASPFEKLRVYRGKLYLYPTPSSVYTFVYEYISNNYIVSTAGTPKGTFTADDDICLFDHRLMVYGIKLKFLASTGQDTTNALIDYNRALEFAKGQSTPGQKLSFDSRSRGEFISTANIPDMNIGL